MQNIIDDIVTILDEKKAEEIRILDLQKSSAFASFMIIATATSTRQVYALYQYVEDTFKKHGVHPHVEGLQQCEWILMFGADIVVHLFLPETREFYALEKMWQMATTADQAPHQTLT
ncbi:MAG: Ribosomal silencing factor RsfS [Holosporales bacterium]